MKHVSCLFILLVAFAVCGCSSEAWDEMPDRAQKFVSQYFPGVEASSTAVGADGQYTVALRNSVTIVFTELGVWLSVDGNGTTLPDNLLFNELPMALYSYLQETGFTRFGVTTRRTRWVFSTAAWSTTSGRGGSTTRRQSRISLRDRILWSISSVEN